MRRNLDELDARRLLTGGPLTIVTSSYRGRHNAAPIAYTMVLSIRPPMIGIAVHPSRYSFDIIKKTDEFALNIPTRELLHHAQYLGSLTGEEFDKLELTKLPYFRARKLNTVLLEGCVGWIECALEDTIELGDHFLMIGRVVAVQADDDAFSDHWLLDDDDLKPLHYLGGNFYSTLSHVMEGRIPQAGGGVQEIARRSDCGATAAQSRRRRTPRRGRVRARRVHPPRRLRKPPQ